MNEITFEKALQDLEEAINKYTDAMNLVKICQEKLDKATKQVNKILSENDELKDFELEGKEESHEQIS